MKRIILCCDGTWNNEDSGDEFTNVARLAWAILPNGEQDGTSISQIVYYHSGVGTGDLVDKIVGGVVGMGLARNVRDAYSFIASNYCEGDQIFLFGFSRGAYTARSIGGLIGWTGLLHKRDMDRFAQLWEGYRLRDQPGQPDIRLAFPDRHLDVPIMCIGVWDTVGSLGIPGHLDQIFTKFYEFHDTKLGPKVRHAYHAMAIDEHRPDFAPTLWSQTPESATAGQQLEQVWFAGVHSNVGGGYSEHGLSDVTLSWMAARLEPLLAIDFDQIAAKQDHRDLWGMGRLYDSSEGFWHLAGRKDRCPFAPNVAGQTKEAIHPSVVARSAAGVACQPRPYASAPFAGLTPGYPVADLLPRERQLQWHATATPQQSAVTAPHPKLLNKVLRLAGGG